MRDRYISSPRPLWQEDETKETPSERVITLGSATAGIVIKINRKGVSFNGYYAGFTSAKKHANMREFIEVSWDDFDKMREHVFRRTPLKKKVVSRPPDMIDDKLDEKYLDSLPIVTLNGKKYFIDMDRKERRPVDDPKQVFNFEKQASKEAD